MKTYLLLLVLIGNLACGTAGDVAKSTDQAKLHGVWLGLTESLNGIQKNVSFLYAFQGDQLTFTDQTGKKMKYSFRLDTTSKPRMLLIQPEEAPANSTPVSLGYELDGNSLKIVVAPPGLAPTDISDKNNQELIICKREGC